MAITLTPTLDADRRALLTRRIRLFVAATITYNLIEAIVAITAGAAASSTALIGFGLDSVIEVSLAAAVAWQFAGKDPQAREQRALRAIAWSFFALAAYVSIDAVIALAGGNETRHSTVGLVLAAVSLVLMPLLSYGQRYTGRQLNSRSAVADSKQTLLCTYLSAVLLVGLAEFPVRLVLGRPAGRLGHCRRGRQRRPRRLEGRRLLCTGHRARTPPGEGDHPVR